MDVCVLLFMLFSAVETVYAFVLPSGMGCYFLKYVITDAWNCGSAPDPFQGSTEDGNVASSLCTSLLPPQRARSAGARCPVCPTGACISQLYSANCFFFFKGHRQWSRRPQPRGSGGDATLRKDTRREHWRCSAQVLLVVGVF